MDRWVTELVEELATHDDDLLPRFADSLQENFAHAGGMVVLEGNPALSWGDALSDDALAFPMGDGGQLWLEAPAHPEVAGMLAHVLSLALARVQLEAALEEAREHLLESSRLKMLGQLAAGVAHEIATPLSAMIISCQSAQTCMAKDPNKAASRLERGWKAAEQVRGIAQKLLSQAREPEREMRPVAVPAMIEETLEVFGTPWRQQGALLDTCLESVPLVSGRSGELQQVLVNLIQNAVQATATAPDRHVVVGCCRRQEMVEFYVADRGPGIDAADLPKIFDPFFTTKAPGHGTGLGLAVCRQIVEQHNGRLEVDSAPQRGAVFKVLLPGLSPRSVESGFRPGLPLRANPIVP